MIPIRDYLNYNLGDIIEVWALSKNKPVQIKAKVVEKPCFTTGSYKTIAPLNNSRSSFSIYSTKEELLHDNMRSLILRIEKIERNSCGHKNLIESKLKKIKENDDKIKLLSRSLTHFESFLS